jgi:hypothetical protein
MNRLEFWSLNVASLVLIGLLIAPFWLSLRNDQLISELNQERETLQKARAAEPVLDQLAKRVALGSEKDARLRELLTRSGLTVTLEVDGETKRYP